MPRSSRPPSYRRHKASGQAVVSHLGKDYYLGAYGSASSRDAYARFIAGLNAAPETAQVLSNAQPSAGTITVIEVLAAFWKHAVEYYRDRDGKPNTEQMNFRTLLKRLRRFAADLSVSEFGPKRLREFRDTLIAEKLARTTINHTMNRVRAIFKWAVGNELVPAAQWEALKAVEPLRFGKTEAVETSPVRPAPDEAVNAVLPYCSAQVAAMIELQRLTGMRSGEVVIMRPQDVDRSGNVWVYTPAFHKTEYRGHARKVLLGPKAQEVLRPWLDRSPDEFLFSPAEAESDRRRSQNAARVTPLSCGNRPGTNRMKTPRKKPGVRYDTGSYGKAIAYALKRYNKGRKERGEPEIHWHPHQLRHAAATRLRKEFGLDVARVVLGHKHASITEVYAEVDTRRAAEVMGQVG